MTAHSNTEKMASLQKTCITQVDIKILYDCGSSRASALAKQFREWFKSQNGYDIGQKRLFNWLREKEYLIRCGSSYNSPTQKAMDLGLFEVIERNVGNADGSVITVRTTKVTGKGQIYFFNKFKEIMEKEKSK